MVILVQQCFVLLLNYVRETMTSATSLGAFCQCSRKTALRGFLGTIDLFIVWVIVPAIGLRSFRRSTDDCADAVWHYLIIASPWLVRPRWPEGRSVCEKNCDRWTDGAVAVALVVVNLCYQRNNDVEVTAETVQTRI